MIIWGSPEVLYVESFSLGILVGSVGILQVGSINLGILHEGSLNFGILVGSFKTIWGSPDILHMGSFNLEILVGSFGIFQVGSFNLGISGSVSKLERFLMDPRG